LVKRTTKLPKKNMKQGKKAADKSKFRKRLMMSMLRK
jgi:hypothetical protein